MPVEINRRAVKDLALFAILMALAFWGFYNGLAGANGGHLLEGAFDMLLGAVLVGLAAVLLAFMPLEVLREV